MTMYVLSLAFFIACVYCQRNRVDLNFEDGRLDAGWRRRLSGGRSLGVTGHVDREGNWGIGASFTFGRKRRSAEQVRSNFETFFTQLYQNEYFLNDNSIV
ncbi:hypothetical protein DPMN_013164 [Dreissena polymorpha]|uniref:Uncharacterized protein n=1 Tax=Dreissena polymorpha TaxID=45954 RepID=A0A9D4N4W3_DREPO|nr:hypothetical protein DPMN_013164 [Dreissena polymorpha]